MLTRDHWWAIAGYALVITVAVLGALLLGLFTFAWDERKAVTVSFLTLAMAQLWHVLSMRDKDASCFYNDIIRNPYVWGALALCIALLLVAIYVPLLADVLQITHPGWQGWALAFAMSIIPLLIGWIVNWPRRAS